MSETVISMRDFSFGYGGKPVLRNISLEVDEGEHVALIGPNGAGKTTLLKCLMRIVTGGEGDLRLRGQPLARYSQRRLARLVSYVPQRLEAHPGYTAREYVLMGRYPYLGALGSFGPRDHRAARRALEITGTGTLAGRNLDTLSGGELQTVGIAAAIAQGAGIMLLDEPTTFLDPRHVSDILGIIRHVNSELGITVLSVTHDINHAALHSRRVVALRAGEVLHDGPAEGVMDNDVLEPVFGMRFSFAVHPDTGARIIVPEAKSS